MGVEAFGVNFEYKGARFWELQDYLVCNEKIRIAHEAISTSVNLENCEYVYQDDLHIIEAQILKSDQHCKCALRFSLCNFETIDEIFIGLCRNQMKLNPYSMGLMISAYHHKDYYESDETEAFLSTLPMEIVGARANWQKLFGAKQGRVSVAESFHFIGVLGRG